MFGIQKHPNGNFRFRLRTQVAACEERVVDTVLPSSKELARRRRELGIMLAKCAGITIAIFGLASMAANVWRDNVDRNDDYVLGEIEFDSNVHPDFGGLTKTDALQAARLRADQSILDVDVTEVRDALMALPQVRKVTVTRGLPNRLHIDIEERRPQAWLVCPEQGFVANDSAQGRLVDDEALLLSCRVVPKAWAQLPRIEIPKVESTNIGKPVTDWQVLVALDLIRQMGRLSWPAPMRLERILLDRDFRMRVILADKVQLDFAYEDVPKQVARLCAIYQYADANALEISSARMQQEKNIAVTFFHRERGEPDPKALTESRGPNGRIIPLSATAVSRPVRKLTRENQQPSDSAQSTQDSPPVDRRSVDAILRGT